MNKIWRIAWAYISEVILTFAIFGLSVYLFGVQEISKVIRLIAADLVTFSGVMLAGSVAFLWTFYSKSDTKFSRWLYEKGAFNVYLAAYIVSVSVYTLLFLLAVVVGKIDSPVLSMFSYWFLILGFVNVYTFVSNIVGQLLLNMEFNRQSR